MPSERSSGPTDSLAPPASPYPSQIEPSPVDSNGTESTEIEEDAQEDPELKSPMPEAGPRLKSPDIEISSPQSTGSVRPPRVLHMRIALLTDMNRNGLRKSTHNCRLARDLIRKKTRRSLSYMSQRASRTLKKVRRIEQLQKRSSRRLPSSLPPLQKRRRAPARRCVLLIYSSKAFLTLLKRPSSVSPVNTDVPRHSDRSTPRAQTRSDLEEDLGRRPSSRRTSSLEGDYLSIAPLPRDFPDLPHRHTGIIRER